MNFSYRSDVEHPVWVSGYYGNYRYQAKVYDEPSEFGIARGRVSKLSVYDKDREIIHYERGWYFGENIISLYQPLITELERIPLIPEDEEELYLRWQI